jgi:hypothetical protein
MQAFEEFIIVPRRLRANMAAPTFSQDRPFNLFAFVDVDSLPDIPF